MEVNTYIYYIIFCQHSSTQYKTRFSKDYAEQSEAGHFLRDNVAEKPKQLFISRLIFKQNQNIGFYKLYRFFSEKYRLLSQI